MHALLEMPVKREREETEGREAKGRKKERTKSKSMVSQRYDSHEVIS